MLEELSAHLLEFYRDILLHNWEWIVELPTKYSAVLVFFVGVLGIIILTRLAYGIIAFALRK